MMKRCPDSLPLERIRTCARSEFVQQALFYMSKNGILRHDKAAVIGWRLYGFASKKHMRDENVFHVRSGAGQGGAIKKAKKLGMKVIVDHSIAHPAEVSRQLQKVISENDITIKPELAFWQLVLKDCEEADGLLVNSDYVKQSFVSEGWDPSNIHVIPLGVREDFLGLKKNYESRGPFKLLFTGNFGVRKGSGLIIKMAEELQNQGVDFELHVVGNVEDRNQIPCWFLKSPYVTLHGHVLQDELKRFLIESDAYIFPTYAEGAAQSVKEAMAAGLPVITTFNSGAPIEHNVNGLIVPVHDELGLVRAVKTLINNVSLRKEIGVAATHTIETEHMWTVYAKKLKGLYYDLCDTE
jgi:glycosyltransferase involved in cell wall biosynthesis